MENTNVATNQAVAKMMEAFKRDLAKREAMEARKQAELDMEEYQEELEYAKAYGWNIDEEL